MNELRIPEIVELHDRYVRQWHDEPGGRTETGIYEVILSEHEANFRLWHAEDEARRRDVGDAYIAEQKRTIDRWNQIRNDYIEKIDEKLIELWPWIVEDASLPINSETPGSVLDRLSIASLKIFHMAEEVARPAADDAHRAQCAAKLDRLNKQRADLAQALSLLLADLHERRKRLQVYRQFKMYNDPNLNPAVYGAKEKKSKTN